MLLQIFVGRSVFQWGVVETNVMRLMLAVEKFFLLTSRKKICLKSFFTRHDIPFF
jgi:hypothetical protein